MKKANGYSNVNRNTSFNPFDRSSYPVNTLASEIVMRQLWLHDNASQVEIIELNSDDSEDAQNDEEDAKFGHIWNYINSNLNSNESDRLGDDYPRAREKKCTQNGDHSQTPLFAEDVDNEFTDAVTNFVYSSFCEGNHYTPNYTTNNHQSNCFTIINKPFNSSDSSSDDNEDGQDYSIRDTRNAVHQSDLINLNTADDYKKNTIWIYSIKNKRRLSEEQFELVNVPIQDCSSSTSHSLENYSEDLENVIKETTHRVGSPIPATYIPRLNLKSPRLPTLTEVTEPDKTMPKETQKFIENPTNHKVNGWLDNKDDRNHSRSHTKIVNWMCLSPRERRRRRFKHTNTTQPVNVSMEESGPKLEGSSRKSPSFKTIETKAEVNVPPNDKTQERQSCSPSKKYHNSKDDNNKKETPLIIVNNENKDNAEEDHDEASLRTPRITISSKNIRNFKIISNPMEGLDINNWIYEDEKEQRPQKHKRNVSPLECKVTQSVTVEKTLACPEDCAGNRLWARNTSLLKPAEWKEYKAITDSIPSLQLSIDIDDEKRSWLNRFVSCFKCCK